MKQYPYKVHKASVFLLIWILCFWILTAIAPLDRYDWAMENILFIILFTGLVATYKKFIFSDISYILIAIFATLHLIGAHYTYAKVPLGFELAEAFDLSRNHFDRIVHFSFGLLLAYPMRELLIKTAKIQGFFSFYLPWNVIVACSAIFEIIEGLFVLAVTPELGEAYLGTQGDSWDAQKDIGLAALGAVLAMGITYTVAQFKTRYDTK